MRTLLRALLSGLVCLQGILLAVPGEARDLSTPEAVIRALVHANASKDLETMAALMAHDPDIISYSIGGRKYVGWEPFAREMEVEFASVARLEIPITHLSVWTRGDTAWFAMELDYIRYMETDTGLQRTVLPLRETGVLARRGSTWIMLGWHESARTGDAALALSVETPGDDAMPAHESPPPGDTVDLSGEWLIQEEDKAYRASLDRNGNGTYTHEGGTLQATSFEHRTLLGRWQQTGNDREGGFEVLFADDGR